MHADKQEKVNAILMRLVKPVFGYALNRTGHRQEAEDLSQEILLQLVKSVSSADDIRSMDSYVWTVARYTWIQWLRKKANKPVDLNGLPEDIADLSHDPLHLLLNSDALRLLRRELSYLSNLQRRIVIMYYYDGLKQADIARSLSLPVGTVKWHLHEAKRELKKGMDRMHTTGQLSFNPIRFSGTGHSGQPGSFGETADFLRRTITQNLVYAAYQKPMTVNELAAELGTAPPFIEDEILYLTEYDYMTEVSPGKYQTNMILWNTTHEQYMDTHSLYKECAREIAGIHFDALMDMREKLEGIGLYYPDDDYNFLLWTLLPKNIEEQAKAANVLSFDYEHVVPIRKDGGRYIASATLAQPSAEQSLPDWKYYEICGPMQRSQGGSLHLWQMDTYWSDRRGWRHLHFKDVQLCHAFWQGRLPDDERHSEDYAFLLSKQYIVRTDDGYRFNAVWVESAEVAQKLRSAMPDLAAHYKPVVSKLYESQYEITMRNKPKHIAPQIEYMTKKNAAGGMLVPYMLKQLIDEGKLKEPAASQRKTITTLMGMLK